MRSVYAIPDWLLLEFPEVPLPPFLSHSHHKALHSLPLVVFLLVAGLSVAYSIGIGIWIYVIDGPIRASWGLGTALTHAVLKCVMELHSPQGRHSMDIVRTASSAYIPKWFFRKTTDILPFAFTISNSPKLSQLVHHVVSKDLTKEQMTMMPHQRSLTGEWVIDKRVSSASDAVVLFLHGGAHIFLSPKTHRSLTVHLSQVCEAPVFSLDYRRCPEARFPSAIEDALASYCFLLGISLGEVSFSASSSGPQAEKVAVRNTYRKVVIMGDSSGGCLTLQLLYLIKAMDLPEPLGGVLISPFIDHDLKSESWHLNWNSDCLSLDIHGIAWAMSIYANGKTVTNPFVSPINLDLRGLPPLLIQVGEAEVVLNDSEKLHKRATDQGVLSELQVYRDMFHVFQVFSYIPEAKEAVKRIGIFFKERVSSEAITVGSHPLGLQVNIRRTRSTYVEELDFVAKE